MAGKGTGVRGAADLTVSQAIRRTLPPRVRDILACEEGVRRRDVEAVHDMRVAVKRLRETTRLFRPAWGKRRAARHLAHLEQLNDGLGTIRELDVLLQGLEDLASRDNGLAEGLQPLTAKVTTERQAADEGLSAVLDNTLSFLQQDFRELIHDRPPKRRRIWKSPFVELARGAVAQRLEAVLALEPAAREPDAERDFHRMRIAVKKLKYALEPILKTLPKPARRIYKPVAQLQELMGLVHDADVLRHVLAQARDDTLAPQVADQALALVAEDRQRLHSETLALLDEVHRRKLPRKLQRALR